MPRLNPKPKSNKMCPDCGVPLLDYRSTRCKPCTGRIRREKTNARVDPPNPSGLCMCGCGTPTPIAEKTRFEQGLLEGHPVRFYPGHQTRKSPVEYIERDCGYITPCWEWQLGTNGVGYGTMTSDGKHQLAHRVYYERKHGPIPAGKTLDHLCRNRGCVNPDHTEPVTKGENTRRGAQAKLTHEIAAEIRRAYAAKEMNGVQLAQKFGVHSAVVYNVIHGRAWPESER